MTLPAPQAPVADIMEAVLLKGDLARLTPDERVRYYSEVCKSMGINPLTKPFEYITLNGKLQLYALRSCTDQLRKINGVSLEIISREVADDILTIHVRAKLPDGRCDEDLGAVAFPSTLKGENRANAELKAVTKAKRRATLSICGLGWLDETEVADIPAKAKAEVTKDGWPAGSIEQPEDYVGNGTRAKDTEPKQEPKYNRLMDAAMTHLQRADMMVHELEICERVKELDDMACEIEGRQDYKNLPDTMKKRIANAYAATLARLKTEIVHDDDGERPARPEDFAEDTAEQIAGSISQRAIDARNGRPPRLREVDG
jgi:hypothetical protein